MTATFHLNTEETIKARIERLDENTQARYQHLSDEDAEIMAKRLINTTKLNQLTGDIAETSQLLFHAREAAKNSGIGYVSEKRERDPKTGAETITREKSDYISQLEEKLKRLQAEKKTLQKKKPRKSWKSEADDQLMASGAPLIPIEEPVEWHPPVGEQLATAYGSEFDRVYELTGKLKATMDAHVPVAEVIAGVYKAIDVQSSESPGFGGFRRGSSIGEDGRLVIGNPKAQIGFIEQLVTPDHAAVDPVKLLLWACKDQFRKACHDHIKATYSDEGTISSADKAKLIPQLEAELWQQRRICEAAYLACWDAGIRNLNRPRDTPVEILLDVIPFSESRKRRPRVARRAEPEVFNFEDDDKAEN